MSKFFTERYSSLVPYTPGEQPKDQQYIKLNTNESPFPPSPSVAEAVKNEVGKLQLYSDPESTVLTAEIAEYYGVKPKNVLVNNGSDETLNFAFMAFADEKRPLYFADITYGFYPVFAELNHIPYTEIPLADDFSIKTDDYFNLGGTIVIANPNAPIGMLLTLDEIESIVKSNKDGVVIIDEAYIDFGGKSAIGLTEKYSNLLVVCTFSKSRSMAGARLGFAIGNEELIKDLNTIKYSTNPYNVNRLTCVAGTQAIIDQDYYDKNCKVIIENRKYTINELEKSGFTVLPSYANFIFASSNDIDGEELYIKLKQMGILVRHFSKEKIKNFNRITIGTKEQMDALLDAVKIILKGKSYENC